jgi:hypothetical protein
MTLKGKFLTVSLIGMLATVLAFAATARAQSQPAAPPQGGDMGPGAMPPGDPVGIVGFEAGLSKKTVTGAPFTATFTNQTTHVLADGNRIARSTSGTLSRDSQGRTRREMTLPAIGPWADASKPAPHMILLNDPVAGTHYVLNPDRKVARNVPAFRLRQHGKQGGGAARQAFAQKQQSQVTTTSLGTQTIAGVTAQGTRYTRTIPAGAIGNEKPIVIVNERWYSPDLQMVVMSKHSDPRMGDTVYQLTNVQRQEPDASLFQVPSDYTVKAANNPGFHGGRGQRGARPMAPPPADNGPAEAPPQQE